MIHPTQTEYVPNVYDAVRTDVLLLFNTDTVPYESVIYKDTSFVGMVQDNSGKTNRIVKTIATVACPVHIEASKLLKRYHRFLRDH